MPVAVKFRPGVDQHVLGEADAPQTALSALHPADGSFVAGGHNDHQVNVAVFIGRTPGVRTEQPDLFGLKFLDQLLCGCLDETVIERFQGHFLARGWRNWKPWFVSHAFA